MSVVDNQIAEIVRLTVQEVLEKLDGAQAKSRLGYTFKEAAEALGLSSVKCVREAHARGEFKARRMGKTYIIPRSELLAWLSKAR